ncbi:MAG: TIM44-like domain-containing protein [Alphaproteobacteria bacterium]|nr:TIM44-like domain-containing protein [Alphaproteobacteria bacterium]
MRGARALALLAALLVSAEAWARVGGGQDFGGGGSGGGSSGWGGGSGDGGGEIAILRLLLWLCIEHPAIGIPLTIAVVVGYLYVQSKGGGKRTYRSHHREAPTRERAPERPFERLRRADPNFSEVLLRDLVQLVFVQAHGARAEARFEGVRPYFSPEALAALQQRPKLADTEVLVGASDLRKLRVRGNRAELEIAYVANVNALVNDQPRKVLLQEVWTWARRLDALSPGPEAMQKLACPACGAAIDTTPEGVCRHCDTPIADGRLQWRVESIQVMGERPVRPPELSLGGGVERGTSAPTVYDPDLPAASRALQGRHPDFAWEDFYARVKAVFLALQESWSAQRWERARPFETDPLFRTHLFQIEQHRRAGLTNHSADVSVRTITPVKVEVDAYYESITVRIKAKMLDWTTDADGRVVGGSERQPRTFTEYWTFVRAAGTGGAAKADVEHCPNCGAPLDRVDLGGVCGYCDTRIVGAEQAWVLSMITQDEVYRG